jgi:hypothetical protein
VPTDAPTTSPEPAPRDAASRDAAPIDRSEQTRHALVDELGADGSEAKRLRRGDAPHAGRMLNSLDDNKTYVYALGAIMTVMSVVLPTAGLYEFFRRVDNLEPIELIGIIAAACAVAAIHMSIAAYVYVDWRKKRLCYRALATLPDPRADSVPSTQSAPSDEDAPSDP